MAETTLHFRYKSSRNYVHGPDIYNQIIAAAVRDYPDLSDAGFKLSMHKLVHHHCLLIYQEQESVRPENAKADFIFSSPKRKVFGWLTETEDPVTEKYEYRESEIIRQCAVNGNSVSIIGEIPYTGMEILVGINKHLHEILLPDAQGKWYFTRVELNHLLSAAKEVDYTMELVQNMHNRLTKSKILSKGQLLGHMYYSLASHDLY